MLVSGCGTLEPVPVPLGGWALVSVAQLEAQAAVSVVVEEDSPAAASALARFRAFFAFRFAALVLTGAKFASVALATAATEPLPDLKCAFLSKTTSSLTTAF